MGIFLQSLFIFILRMVGISVGTVGTILTVQGRKLPAILTGSLSSLVYLLAIGQVVTNLDNVWKVTAYIAGYATGTWVGMVLEERIALGFADVRVISTTHGAAVATALRDGGFGATELYGRGLESPVSVVEAVVPRKNVSAVIRLAEEADQRAIVTVSEARSVQRAYWRSPYRR